VIISLQTGTSPFSFNGLGQSSAAIDIVLNVAGRAITVSAETGYVY
jgi:hypothetical protein